MAVPLIKSVINSIVCLQHLAASRDPVGVREMARFLELDSAKVSRLLKTLESVGLAQQNRQRKYSVGPGIQVLAALSIHSSQFYRAAIECVENFPHENFVIALGVLWRGQSVYLIHARPGRSAAQSLGAYEVLAADRSMIGLSLLSRQSDEEIVETIGEKRFAAIRADIDAARREKVFIKEYPDNEVRLAMHMKEFNASIAFSRIMNGAGDAVAGYAERLQALAQSIHVRAAELSGQD